MEDRCILDPEVECIGKKEALRVESELFTLVQRNADTHQRLFDTIGELQKLNELQARSIEGMVKNVDSLAGKIEKLSDRINGIELKPAKRWESLVGQIIGVLVAAVIGFMLARVGL